VAELVAVGSTIINLDHVIVAEVSGLEGGAAAAPKVSLRLSWTSQPLEVTGEDARFLAEALMSLALTKPRVDGDDESEGLPIWKP